MLPVVKYWLFEVERLFVESGFNLTFKGEIALVGSDPNREVIPERIHSWNYITDWLDGKDAEGPDFFQGGLGTCPAGKFKKIE